MAKPRAPKGTIAFTSPSIEKLTRLKVQPKIKMAEKAPAPPATLPEQKLTDEGRPAEFPSIDPPTLVLRTLPLQTKMLADSLIMSPAAGLGAHAKTAGMTIPQAREALLREDVREYIGDYLDRAGATVDASCRAIGEALDAEKVLQTKDGPLTLPDHEYRLRAAELSLKLRGLLKQNDNAEQPLTLAALIVAIQQERARRALDVTPCSLPPSDSQAPHATSS